MAAELARLTGWTHFDARQYSQARSYFGEACSWPNRSTTQFMANVLRA
ncbi:hypothetical protein MBT84_47975 [Streptomyces sp. MBT84]|nr:hypothetical protein [Streptomyces sp. MBT84]MBW8707400.1 hypothetical protein [Streptomyces sp. MBT84]